MRRARVSWAGHGDLAASCAAIAPLALVYGVALAWTRQTTAVDVANRSLWTACGHDARAYLAIYLGLALGYLLWLARAGQRRAVSLPVVAPLVAESALYALSLVTVAALLSRTSLGLGAAAVVAALGAGVYEELWFRLGALAGGAALLRHLGVRPVAALSIATVASTIGFAVAHHLAGEPWAAGPLVFRAIAGLGFAAICWRRSLAHAVYAHALYDLWVALVVR